MTSLIIANQTVADAKSNFSQLIRLSQETPQIISNRGKAVCVMLGISEYKRLVESASKNSFKSRLRNFLAKSKENFPEKINIPSRKSRKPISF
jgi:prevent-host-death family protein